MNPNKKINVPPKVAKKIDPSWYVPMPVAKKAVKNDKRDEEVERQN